MREQQQSVAEVLRWGLCVVYSLGEISQEQEGPAKLVLALETALQTGLRGGARGVTDLLPHQHLIWTLEAVQEDPLKVFKRSVVAFFSGCAIELVHWIVALSYLLLSVLLA